MVRGRRTIVVHLLTVFGCFCGSSGCGVDHQRVTLRQTQVLVIPANEDILDFPVFDSMIAAINQARRNARDYVTDVSLDRLDENMYGEGDRDWV